jgi:fatty acid desaturase
MLTMEGISTEAKIGKILILIAIIFAIIQLIAIAVIGSVGFSFFLPAWVGGIVLIVALVKVVGIIIGIIAFRSAEDGDYKKAGILAIIASLIPPLDIIMIIGGIVCLIAPEASSKLG